MRRSATSTSSTVARFRLLDPGRLRSGPLIRQSRHKRSSPASSADQVHGCPKLKQWICGRLKQERIGEKTVGALMLELEGHGHRFTLVTPAGLARHDILDHPEVYPQVKAITTASCLSPRPW
jgi:hypothetical protein